MTNIEYYGFDNIIFMEHSLTNKYVVVHIYYSPKHAKDLIPLRSEPVMNNEMSIRNFKSRWMLAENNPIVYNTDDTYIDGLECYKMRHFPKVRRQFTWD